MNFYKRHIGDYLRDAGHLTLLEHGVYTRLLDVYYTRESALPADQTARLIGARTREEREAVDRVLAEFFELVDGVWRQSRCEREIEAATTKAERNREVGKRGGRPRKPETQAEPKPEPRNNPDGFCAEPKQNPSQIPDTRHQTKAKSEEARAPDPGPEPTLSGRACRLMRVAGATGVNPSDPRLLQLLSQGVTPQQLGDLAAELRERGKAPGMAYVVATMAGRLADAVVMPQAPPGTAQRIGAQKPSGFGAEMDRISSAIDRARGAVPQPETIDVEARHVG